MGLAEKFTLGKSQKESLKEMARLTLSIAISATLSWLVRQLPYLDLLTDQPTFMGWSTTVLTALIRGYDKFLHEEYKERGVDKKGLFPF